MREVSEPIQQGAEGFLKVQYTTIFRYAAVLAIIIPISYFLRPSSDQATTGVENLGNGVIGILASISFLLGAGCSAATGYISMWVSAHSNIRVASAARFVLSNYSS